jgi:hypothetical protein
LRNQRTFRITMTNSKSPVQVSVPSGTVALLLNVVMPSNREQGGFKDRYKLVFYRNNVEMKSRAVLLKGPKVFTVASPSGGISWVISFKLWPMAVNAVRLDFPVSIDSPVIPFAIELQKFSGIYKIPQAPGLNLVDVKRPILNAIKVLPSCSLNAIEFNPKSIKVILDTSHSRFFKSNPNNAKLLKQYESSRIF